jgi:hypothetical protein
MKLEELKQHLAEVRSTLYLIKKCHGDEMAHFMDPDYFKRLCDFLDKFKYWKPEVFIHVEKGLIQTIFANEDIVVNLWDDDVEKKNNPDENEVPYDERRNEWEQMIESNLNSGEIKQIL